MNHNKKEHQEEDETKKLEEEKDIRYPVDEIPEDEKPTEKNVEKEVKEINPTIDSLGKR